MTLRHVHAHCECDDCGGLFHISVDPALKCESVFDAVEETLMGGAERGEDATYYDDGPGTPRVMRCETCTRNYMTKWLRENPNKLNGCKEGFGPHIWVVSTYGGQEDLVVFSETRPVLDTELSLYALVTITED